MKLPGILPCPWCGKIPRVFPVNPHIHGNAWAVVRCVNRLCSAQPSVVDGMKKADNRGSDRYKLAAIRKWNKRKVTI